MGKKKRPQVILYGKILRCEKCASDQIDIKCTRAGTFISYFRLTCDDCEHTWEDRWQD